MKVYPISSDEARMADVRIRIVHDNNTQPPWANCDLVFNPLPNEVFNKPLHDVGDPDAAFAKRTFIGYHDEPIMFYTTKERIKELCGDDPKFYTPEGIENLCWLPEKQLIEEWYAGHTYCVIHEKWNPTTRMFERISDACGIVGKAELADYVKDMHECDDVVVDETATQSYEIV